ncbi:MAG: endonuclease domain-containing protein [Rhodanobacteraceae bacterium]
MLRAVRQARTRKLRKRSTDVEQLLWRHLRNRNLGGFKFRRQVPPGSYIVDFVCMEQRLIIELDGGQHLDAEAQDRLRTLYLERGGFHVLRFWNDKILAERDAVMDAILRALTSPHPNPLPQAGEGAKA